MLKSRARSFTSEPTVGTSRLAGGFEAINPGGESVIGFDLLHRQAELYSEDAWGAGGVT